MFTIEFKSERDIRLARMRELMITQGIEACLINSNANIYYLSNRVFRGYIYVSLTNEPIYFVIRPSGLHGENIVEIRKPEQISAELEKLQLSIPVTLGLEYDDLSYTDVERLKKAFVGITDFHNVSVLMKQCRMVKTPYEIAMIKDDAARQSAAYKQIPHLYQEGMTDIEFQIRIESVLRREGCLGFYRTSGNLMEINMGSVLNGENADTPTPYDFAVGGGGADSSLPVGADGRIMRPGTTVMVDMNGNFNGYQSDMTRVWKIGDIPSKAEHAHNVSIRILRELEKMSVPGIPVASLYERAKAIAIEENVEEYFMGHKQRAAFIGHGVGIQLNELPVLTPRSKDVLQENMVIAIEPKFVIPEVGAVGVENTYVVTSSGLKQLTEFPEQITNLI